jgi:hypothetical protein
MAFGGSGEVDVLEGGRDAEGFGAGFGGVVVLP